MISFNLLNLPNPELGDSETLKLRVGVHQMKSGAVYTYVGSPSNRFLLKFTLTKLELAAFEAWLYANRGAEITYTNSLGTAYKGAIVNNPFEIVCELGTGDCALYSLTVEFEGTV